ncbi:MAG: phosphatase PAP2 family protein [Pirellulales bacterium]
MLLVSVIGSAVVAICYFWIDRPVAWFVYDHGYSASPDWKDLTLLPPWGQVWSPLVLTLLAIRRSFGPLDPWQRTLFVSGITLIVSDQFRVSLGDLCGRYWPETWFGNPSLIGDGAYGFHPFVRGDDIGSFPSGHAARIVSFATVWWFAFSRLRLMIIAICLPLLVALVAMNYHFVGDVVAGSVLGGIVGRSAVAIDREFDKRFACRRV